MSDPVQILLVEDNPVVLLGLSQLLRAAGYAVAEARTGAEGLWLAGERVPDVILLDVVLPDCNGVELCRRIKTSPALGGAFVVLLSSVLTASEQQATGLDAGADGYIARPIENRELVARVQSLVRIQQAELGLRRARAELERRVRERTEELTQANAALQAAVARQRELSLRLVEVQEDERRALARELHDQFGQLLTGLKLGLELALPRLPEPVRADLAESKDLVDDLLGRVRRLSLDLRPPMLDDFGLIAAVEGHLRRFSKQCEIQVDFRHTPVTGRWPAKLETAVYRIVQEALTNIARHAGVKTAAVRLWQAGGRLGVQIEDDGQGFEVERVLVAGVSSGLAGMRERALLLEGEFSIESAPGAGTQLTVEFPLATAAADVAGETEIAGETL